PEAADHTEAYIKVVEARGVRAQVEAEAHQDAARKRASQRPELVLNSTGNDKAESEDDHRDGEHHRRIGPLPSKAAFERRDEHAPSIERPQRQVHRESACHAPPAANPAFRLHSLNLRYI